MIAGKLQGAVEKFAQINFFADHLLGGGGLPRFQEIPASNLMGRKADDLRDTVHVPLHGEQTLRRSEAAKRPVRRGIGGECLGTDANARPVVRSASVNGPARQHHGREGCIGSAINGEIDFPAQYLSVLG